MWDAGFSKSETEGLRQTVGKRRHILDSLNVLFDPVAFQQMNINTLMLLFGLIEVGKSLKLPYLWTKIF